MDWSSKKEMGGGGGGDIVDVILCDLSVWAGQVRGGGGGCRTDEV